MLLLSDLFIDREWRNNVREVWNGFIRPDPVTQRNKCFQLISEINVIRHLQNLNWKILWPVLSRENHALPDCSVMAGRAGYHTVGKIKKLQSEHKGNVFIFLGHCNRFPTDFIFTQHLTMFLRSLTWAGTELSPSRSTRPCARSTGWTSPRRTSTPSWG